MRWSRLKTLLKEIFDPELDLEIHCTAFRGGDGPSIGRYWIILNGETIFDQPPKISRKIEQGLADSTATEITGVLRSYLDTPKDLIFSAEFPNDRFGLVDLLRAADRRIGKRRLAELIDRDSAPAVRAIIKARYPELFERRQI